MAWFRAHSANWISSDKKECIQNFDILFHFTRLQALTNRKTIVRQAMDRQWTDNGFYDK